MRISGYAVIKAVSAHYGIRMPAFEGRARHRAVARPRQVAFYLMRQLCPHLSYPAIGRMLGNRDHTTVLHGVRKIEELMAEDRDMAREVEELANQLRADAMFQHAVVPFPVLCAAYSEAMRRAA